MATKTPSSQTRKRESMDLNRCNDRIPRQTRQRPSGTASSTQYQRCPQRPSVLVTVLRCGVDGTDPAISNAEYGATRRRQPRLKLSNVFRAEKKQWQRKRLVRRPENGNPWI